MQNAGLVVPIWSGVLIKVEIESSSYDTQTIDIMLSTKPEKYARYVYTKAKITGRLLSGESAADQVGKPIRSTY